MSSDKFQIVLVETRIHSASPSDVTFFNQNNPGEEIDGEQYLKLSPEEQENYEPMYDSIIGMDEKYNHEWKVVRKDDDLVKE